MGARKTSARLLQRLPAGLVKRGRDVLEGMWFRPSLLLVLGIVLGEVLPRLDMELAASRGNHFLEALFVKVGATPQSAWEVLSTTAGLLATIVAVAFSITTVTVQLAGSRYTPRLLRNFMSDKVTQRILGAFLGTVAYLVLVLRSVRGPLEGGESGGFVPMMSLLVGILFFVGCLALLPVFLHHLTRSIQVSTLVTDAAKRAIHSIENLADSEARYVERGEVTATALLRSKNAGYIQVFDEHALLEALPQSCGEAQVHVAVGDFVVDGMPLVSVDGGGEPDEETTERMRHAFGFARERNHPQDVLFAVRQLVDMGLKGLSPGINDVTTSIMVVNELAAIAVALDKSGAPAFPSWKELRDGKKRLLVPALSMEVFLRHALDEMILSARGHPRVLGRMLELLAVAASLAQRNEVRRAYLEQGARVRDVLERSQEPAAALEEAKTAWKRLRIAAESPDHDAPPPPFIQ